MGSRAYALLPRLTGRRATADDADRLTSRLLVTEGEHRNDKLSSFWVLILLSAVIATAGVIADSTATVIGAMIVAPLMTPILGTALAIVLSNRRLMVLNILLVLLGAVSVIVIGYLLGLTTGIDLTAATNTQIAGRVSPRLIDLLAALATGVVGAFATVRSDISDTLPGVAIAISLVPPLAVVGLTLESGATDQAVGALLLFMTNVSAIVATGTLIFLAYGIRHAAAEAGIPVGHLHRSTIVTVVVGVALLAVPLGVGSTLVVQQEVVVSKATPVATAWAEDRGWQVQSITYAQKSLRIVALGPPPSIDEKGLRQKLDEAGLEDVDARVTLVIGGSKELSANP
ncbi:MAG: TIGR00341 family protein [Propioniciclava sp.]